LSSPSVQETGDWKYPWSSVCELTRTIREQCWFRQNYWSKL